MVRGIADPPCVGIDPQSGVDRHVADMATLTVDDVVLICHLFYLPYEHGPRATAMLHSVAWLLKHLPAPVGVELHSPLSPASSSDDDDDARCQHNYSPLHSSGLETAGTSHHQAVELVHGNWKGGRP